MTRHYSVLLQESIDALNCQSDGIYVDGTLGRGGHSLEIARRLQTGHLYAFDLDEQALAESAQRLADFLYPSVHFMSCLEIKKNFCWKFSVSIVVV